jgi:hypothetical protein
MSTFNGRLNATVEYYNSLTTDLFQGNPLSLTSGYRELTANVGALRNRGVELFLNSGHLRVGGFTWNVNANLTYKPQRSAQTGGRAERDHLRPHHPAGGPADQLHLRGALRRREPRERQPAVRQPEGVVTEDYNPEDRVIVGLVRGAVLRRVRFFPQVQGPRTERPVQLRGRQQEFTTTTAPTWRTPAYFFDNMSAAHLDEWRKPADITQIPSPNATFRESTTHFVEKGDFLRLRNVMLSYALPASLIGRAKLSAVRPVCAGPRTWPRGPSSRALTPKSPRAA